jgi:hypothetical protein
VVSIPGDDEVGGFVIVAAEEVHAEDAGDDGDEGEGGGDDQALAVDRHLDLPGGDGADGPAGASSGS